MKKIIFPLLTILIWQSTYSQNIGINSTGANPDNSAMLDVVSSNRGLLMPRVQLTATNAAGPITLPTTSLFVYNIAAAGAGVTAVTPGYYYNSGTTVAPNWVRISTDGDHWKITGNSGTTASASGIGVAANNNFIGTTDAVDYVFVTNGFERMRLKTDNNTTARLGIGTAFTSNLNGTATPSLIHLHDWGTTANDMPILQLSMASTTSGRTVGVINFASTATANEKRVATIESYLTAASATNASGDLRFSTNNVNSLSERFRIPNADQVHAMADGTTALPFYTWNADANTGMWRSGADLLNFSTNALERLEFGTTEAVINDISVDYDFRVESNGDANALFVNGGTNRVGIGLNAPTTKLEVSSGTQDAIYGHGTNVGGYVGYETNFNIGTAGALQGAGLWAANPTAGYTSAYAQSSGSATVAANISFSSVWIANYNLVDNASNSVNPSALYSQLNVTNTGLGGIQSASNNFYNRGAIAGNPGYSNGGSFTVLSDNQDALGVWGTTFSDQGSGGTINFGGYFEAYNYTGGTQRGYAFVGGRTGNSNRKIEGVGSVNEIVPTKDHGRVTLVCPESPEYWYQDYYTVEMINGKAHLDLDPILVDIIVVDQDNPIRVFATPSNMLYFNGVTIMNQTSSGVDLVELNGGTNSGTLQVQVIVKPKTNFGEGRFVQAPGPAWLKQEFEPQSAKAANQGSPNIFNWPSDWEVYGYEEHAKKVLEERQTPPKLSNDGK